MLVEKILVNEADEEILGNEDSMSAEETPVEKKEEKSEAEQQEIIDNSKAAADWLEQVGLGNRILKMKSLTDALDYVFFNNVENLEDGGYYQPVNLLIIGEPGGGKTSIINNWAKNRDIAFKSMTGSELTDTIVQGLPFADDVEDPKDPTKKYKKQRNLPSTVFDVLDDAKGRYSVLFLDELNRSWKEAEAGILSLIQDHTISDINYENDKRKFNKFVFTIAACNPPETNREARALGLALKTRFRVFFWESNPKETGKFWVDVYNQRIEKIKKDFAADGNEAKYNRKLKKYEGRKKIITALVESDEFEFSDGDEIDRADKTSKVVLNARTLASCLEMCDGTVGEIIGIDDKGENVYKDGSFLSEYKFHCGDDTFPMVEEILEPLAEEIDDEANAFQKTLFDSYNQWKRRYLKNNSR